ncbi:cathepsin B-like cysteine proteinase 6 [Daktulosphaira vitifoliae]|uniref:cathepsin B-like cysteine proteinase 6 n=1 Tax=Daktulosphaira vitifoliae TaxID=58002 RepID=UPI0021A9E32F|nr:cathepsin B-like cysteine proteinase 6 [Daktulosphaira vitifoliae]
MTANREKELIEIINSTPNTTWQAGSYPNKVYQFNIIPKNTTEIDSKIKKLFGFFKLSYEIPVQFDARVKWSSINSNSTDKCPSIKKVFNNGKCKCGWAVAIASVLSDRQCIASEYKIKHSMSAHYLISCCKHCCGCNGGNIRSAWEFVKHKGIVTGGPYKSNLVISINDNGCQPFMTPPCQRTFECSTETSLIPECMEKTCRSHKVNDEIIKAEFIKTYVIDYLSLPRKHPSEIMKDLMEYGPLQVSMHMYEDFRVYTTGIYTHIVGEFEGDHAVKLIGWGTDNGHKYWLLINSFGYLWGENGTFRIPRDGSDNTEFGYAIISPIVGKAIQPTTCKIIILYFYLAILLV